MWTADRIPGAVLIYQFNERFWLHFHCSLVWSLPLALRRFVLDWIALRCVAIRALEFISFDLKSIHLHLNIPLRGGWWSNYGLFSLPSLSHLCVYVFISIPKMCQSFAAKWLYDFWILRKLRWIMYANVIDPQPQHGPVHCILFACPHRAQSAECWWPNETGPLSF